ncbi:MAG: preprotein translocase subunit YajC [Alphaproteobacteria bacterium]|nr:preprotein translocase subunit YajC [Alphaproteobacteria bacterium]
MIFDINKAYAAEAPGATQETVGTAVTPQMPDAPSPMSLVIQNIAMVGILVVLFYVLLIVPQQRRFREHSQMLSGLKKGDKVVTGGGLIGTIDKIGEGDEAVIDLGSGVKVTVLRNSLQSRESPLLKKKAANDAKDQKK